jgi:hypothetical protein
MRLVAHPLVVAAAMGLIGPAALAEEERAAQSGCATCGAGPDDACRLPAQEPPSCEAAVADVVTVSPPASTAPLSLALDSEDGGRFHAAAPATAREVLSSLFVVADGGEPA